MQSQPNRVKLTVTVRSATEDRDPMKRGANPTDDRRPRADVHTLDQPTVDRSMRLRLRAAWMYYVERMTQNEIADALGIGRVTVVRLLADAVARNEVKITIEGDLAELVGIERKLEQRFGLTQAIVAPIAGDASDRTHVVSAATGAFISEFVRPGMRLGAGWGRTLIESLAFMPSRQLGEFTVVSLLGGITEARRFNPSEYAWQLAQAFGGDCYLLSAPAVVDSPQTRDVLIEKCGLHRIFDMAKTLDAAILSVGGMAANATIFQSGYMGETDRISLAASGAVGDVLYHFYDRAGVLIDHPLNERVMSIPSETIRAIPQRVLTSGGVDKPEAILGAIKFVKPTVMITDALTAAAVLALDSGKA
jgi:DNA-binding transcriptional regulator LsrR (DeoR family)